jgi:hypothetical protein
VGSVRDTYRTQGHAAKAIMRIVGQYEHEPQHASVRKRRIAGGDRTSARRGRASASPRVAFCELAY